VETNTVPSGTRELSVRDSGTEEKKVKKRWLIKNSEK
jgi:hypothetical protein